MKDKTTFEKFIIFEHLRYTVLIVAILYAIRGFKVIYLNADPKILKLRLINKFLKILDIQKAFEEGIEYRVEIICQHKAMDNVEEVYKQKFANKSMIRRMVEKVGSEKIHSIYKKELAEKLYNFFRVKYTLIETCHNMKLKHVVFVPEKFTIIRRLLSRDMRKELLVDDIDLHIPAWGCLYSRMFFIFENIKWFGGFMIFPVWIFSKIRKITFKDCAKKGFKVGLRIYRTDHAFYYKYRKVDFLLDDINLNKDNTVFCVETAIDDDYRKNLEQRHYNIVDIPKILVHVTISFLFKLMLKGFLLFWAVLLKDIFTVPSFCVKATLKSLYTYLHWKRFLELFQIDNYVVYNDFASQHIIRNILLSKTGTKTWYYMHSRNFGDLYMVGNDSKNYIHYAISYLYYDNFVSWGKADVFLKQHPHYIGNFLKLGCLWSEHTAVMSKEKVMNDLGVAHNLDNKKIIGVFDTTFGKSVPLKTKDMVLFLKGILRILDDFPEIVVIFKEKNPIQAINSTVISYIKDLKNNKRCYVPGCTFEPSEVIKISDMVICACFTSPAIEALDSKRKAIYFDPDGQYRGTYYDKFPKMIAHNYQDLKSLVEYWLYEIDENGFDEYLEKHIKHEQDLPMDGKAITRFRELLTKEV